MPPLDNSVGLKWQLGLPMVFDDSFIHSAVLPSGVAGFRTVLHVGGLVYRFPCQYIYMATSH